MAARGAAINIHMLEEKFHRISKAARMEEIPCSRREIIRQVIKERKRQHMTQKELADKIGLKQSNISRLETGKSNPSIDFLQRVAKGLGKDLHVEIR